ncbi:MAG: hypothetical protein L0216_11365 [Planctomycetales bacterium]|nr:hypothetical protein [Planctomycetales bacterium]
MVAPILGPKRMEALVAAVTAQRPGGPEAARALLARFTDSAHKFFLARLDSGRADGLRGALEFIEALEEMGCTRILVPLPTAFGPLRLRGEWGRNVSFSMDIPRRVLDLRGSALREALQRCFGITSPAPDESQREPPAAVPAV